MSWRVLRGDCVEEMAAMPAASVDAMVCDPPYNLGFMSRPWDMQHDHEPWSCEALRVLKPGGHLLAFGGTRTYHRLACAIEDAGFEIRDTIAWLYGSGFPKSRDVGKDIDKAAGAEREVVRAGQPVKRMIPGADQNRTGSWIKDNGREFVPTETAPATPEAQQWDGWGTALKPAHEPIVVARKPLTGTVAANVLAHGTGALNIDGCRIGFRDEADERESKDKNRHADFGSGPTNNQVYGKFSKDREDYDAPGRWPANVVLDEPAAELLDAQTGERPHSFRESRHHQGGLLGWRAGNGDGYSDSGGASRFFYVAKASRAERNAGLDHFAPGELRTLATDRGPSGEASPNGQTATQVQNVHPTVKPIALMRWLCRLVTPPGGTVLDPFTGSGTTGIATVLEGFDFIGIERESEYAAIARARIAHWWAQPVQLGLDAA